MTPLRRRAVVVAIATLVVAVALVAFATRNHARATKPALERRIDAGAADRVDVAPSTPLSSMIRVAVVEERPLPLSAVLPARIAYDEDRTARVTTAFAGRIVKLVASPGDAVRIGSPLAEIDSPDFALAASDLAKARADEERKRLTLARSRDLLSGGVVPRKDVEGAEADFAQARAETVRAAQRVRNIDPSGSTMRGGDFALTSPMTGIVTERNANPAMEIGPTLAQPLFVISDLARLWVTIDVPEQLVGQIAPGMHVALETDAYPGTTFDATIAHVAPVLDAATRRIAVRATVDNADRRLRPEMFVRATVLRDHGTGVRVPNDALVTDGLYTYVWRRDGEHGFRRVRVEPVVRGSESSYVDRALSPGDAIVVSGALLLAAGPRETPVQP